MTEPRRDGNDGQPLRARVRKLLGDVLLSLADFEAFCIDYLPPELAQELEAAPSLKDKHNLLLLSMPADELRSLLRTAHPERVRELEARSESSEPLRVQRERELSDRLAELLQEKEVVKRWGGDPGKIDAEILKAQRELRHGPTLRVGEVVGGTYRLVRVIGKGTFAAVYQAQVVGGNPDDSVALKVLLSPWSADRSAVGRFESGVSLLEKLASPNIVKIYGPAAAWQGFHYFAMEYLAGGDLHQAVLRDKSGERRDRFVRAVLDAGRALAAAHRQIPTFVHRDVKPGNILLDEHGNAKLCDFDLGLDDSRMRVTQTGQGLGTREYSAPEQLINAAYVDRRADVYSLARCMLFVLNRGPLDHTADTSAIVERISMPQVAREVLRLATSADRRHRHANLDELCEELEVALALTSTAQVRRSELETLTEASPEGEGSPFTDPDPSGALATDPDPSGALATDPDPSGARVAEDLSEASAPAPRSPEPRPYTPYRFSVPTALVLPPPDDSVSTLEVKSQRGVGRYLPFLAAGGLAVAVGVGASLLLLGSGPSVPAVAPDLGTASLSGLREPASPPIEPGAALTVPGMIYVPAGRLAVDKGAGELAVTGFHLDRADVTVEAYRKCVQARACKAPSAMTAAELAVADRRLLTAACTYGRPGREHQPVNCIDLAQAAAYCRFMDKRLPSDEEWEYAVRGGAWAASLPAAARGGLRGHALAALFGANVGFRCARRPSPH